MKLMVKINKMKSKMMIKMKIVVRNMMMKMKVTITEEKRSTTAFAPFIMTPCLLFCSGGRTRESPSSPHFGLR